MEKNALVKFTRLARIHTLHSREEERHLPTIPMIQMLLAAMLVLELVLELELELNSETLTTSADSIAFYPDTNFERMWNGQQFKS